MTNEEKILEMLATMQSEMGAMRSDMADLKATQTKQGEQLAKQGEQLTRLEDKVGELDERSLRSAVLLENEVAPKVQLLFEGHRELKRELGALATKEQVEELSGDVDVIKEVVSRHSGDIGKLKKAQ